MPHNKSTITMEQLVQNGWTMKGGDPVFIAVKKLSADVEDNDPDDGELKLVLHTLNNCQMFALCLPDGAMLNINPGSIGDLKKFETLIYSYEPNY